MEFVKSANLVGRSSERRIGGVARKRKLEAASLKKDLLEIRDMNTLIVLRRNISSDLVSGRLIEARMVEVLGTELPKIREMDALICLWRDASFCSESIDLIEARMVEVLWTELPKIRDMDKLNFWLKSVPFNSKSKSLIEARIRTLRKKEVL